MSIVLGICLGVLGVLIILGSVTLIAYQTENSKEHEQLRAMDCSDPPKLIEWADKHPRWLDHQTYARQLFVVCTVGGEKPTLNH